VAVSCALVALLTAMPAAADNIHEDAVFQVHALCGSDKYGTAFLVQDWPIVGQVALVTALHVVHQCSAIELTQSPCASNKWNRNASITKDDRIEFRAWNRRDVAVFLNVGGLAWASGVTPFKWGKGTEQIPTGSDLAVAGRWHGLRGCFAENAGADSAGTTTTLGNITSENIGTLDPAMRTILYKTGGPGKSGGPVTFGGVVVGIHEAGLRDQAGRKVALRVFRDLTPTVTELFPPNWSQISFTAPPNAESAARQDENVEAHANPDIARISLMGGVEYARSAPASTGGRIRFGLGADFRLASFGSNDQHGLYARVNAGWLRSTYERRVQDPAGRPFEVTAEDHAGLSFGAGPAVRFTLSNTFSLELLAAFRGDNLSGQDPNDRNRRVWTWGAFGEARIGAILYQRLAFIAAGHLGGEYAPKHEYRYEVFPIRLEDLGWRLGLLGGASVGFEVAW
jgi:hypothetical protein